MGETRRKLRQKDDPEQEDVLVNPVFFYIFPDNVRSTMWTSMITTPIGLGQKYPYFGKELATVCLL